MVITSADTIAMVMELESGAVGTWAMTHASSRSDAEFQVIGTNGTLVLDNLSRLRYHKPNGTHRSRWSLSLSLLELTTRCRSALCARSGEVEETVFEAAAGKAKQDLVDEFRDFHQCIARIVDGARETRPSESAMVEQKDDDEEEEESDFVMLPHAPLVRVEDTHHHLAVIDAAIASTQSKRREPIKSWQEQQERSESNDS
jgi:predicted dehydrogenase